MKKLRIVSGVSKAIFVCSAFMSFQIYAGVVRDDFDVDDDGLIEINDLNDLHEIRNNLDGGALYNKNVGCPDSGCNGFELTRGLDFDTNGDGQLSGEDDFWNEGEGWLPLGGEVSEAAMRLAV